MTVCDRGRELSDRLVEDVDVVRDRVGRGVARSQHRAQRLTGRICEAEHGVEAVAALEGGGGLLFGLGVHVDERGVDVEDDGVGPVVDVVPHFGAHLFQRSCEGGSSRADQLVERSEHRRVRRHRAEERVLDAQVFDVAAALAATGEHERHLDEDLASVVQRWALTGGLDALRQRSTETDPVRKGAQCVQPDVGRNTGATRFHTHASRRSTVHLEGALRVG